MARNLYQEGGCRHSCYFVDRFAVVVCTGFYGTSTDCRIAFQHDSEHRCRGYARIFLKSIIRNVL